MLNSRVARCTSTFIDLMLDIHDSLIIKFQYTLSYTFSITIVGGTIIDNNKLERGIGLTKHTLHGSKQGVVWPFVSCYHYTNQFIHNSLFSNFSAVRTFSIQVSIIAHVS